ncbi:hypothetical protein O181_051014 [Austropuccinia psidii MF-1]|uniref:Uncharacterized protein n=1 Tax=Austropuccinia psidii MF-1 TaxID=1389203 RepID=A0A9Q3HQ98_9BASI|nr:hypothetical protein [Austropuccinia psidii MF-1]
MSLKGKALINTIHNTWVITSHASSQRFGMLMLMHEMTSTPLSENIPPLPCLLLHMNWLPHSLLIISASDHAYAYYNIAFCIYSTYHPYASTPQPHHLCSLPCLGSCKALSCSQFTILILMNQFLLISPIYHLSAHTHIGFCFTASTSLPYNMLTLSHSCLIILKTYHDWDPALPYHVLNLTYLCSGNPRRCLASAPMPVHFSNLLFFHSTA